jgi:hypothetical protein
MAGFFRVHGLSMAGGNPHVNIEKKFGKVKPFEANGDFR